MTPDPLFWVLLADTAAVCVLAAVVLAVSKNVLHLHRQTTELEQHARQQDNLHARITWLEELPCHEAYLHCRKEAPRGH